MHSTKVGETISRGAIRMATHMPQANSARSQGNHGCGRRATLIGANPRFVSDENPIVPVNAWTLQPETAGEPKQAAARRLAPSLDYMRKHLNQPVTISTLSAMLGLSSTSFFALFRTVTNDTPLNWLIRTRMRRACELLKRTNLPIKQIADEVGYEDPLYFSRAFKSVCGTPPTEYRARTRREVANVVAA